MIIICIHGGLLVGMRNNYLGLGWKQDDSDDDIGAYKFYQHLIKKRMLGIFFFIIKLPKNLILGFLSKKISKLTILCYSLDLILVLLSRIERQSYY